MNAPAQRRKSLLILLGAVIIVGLLKPIWGPRYDWFLNEQINSQWQHLREVRARIEMIRPKWDAFTNQNAGFESVALIAFSYGDGMFGANGTVPSKDHERRLQAFLESTRPPRPICMDAVFVFEPKFVDQIKRLRQAELTRRPNRKQPNSPDKNQTP